MNRKHECCLIHADGREPSRCGAANLTMRFTFVLTFCTDNLYLKTLLLCCAEFAPALGRECGTAFHPPIRFKPYPDSLLHVAKQWGVEPNEMMFVGDSAPDDVSTLLVAMSIVAFWKPGTSADLAFCNKHV